VFTQLHPEIAGARAARVPVGSAIEVQLPGRPVEWGPTIAGAGVRRRGDTTGYPSVGQYDGASAVLAFPFAAVRRVGNVITFDGAPPPAWLEEPFVLRLENGRRDERQ
jgi:hypothetical protein